MAVIIDKKVYEKPAEDQYLAVIADVIDLGLVETKFGARKKVQIVYILDSLNSEGENFKVSQFFNQSLHEKAGLRKALKVILRRDVSDTVDLDECIGVTVGVVIEHNKGTDGEMYANISALIPAPKGQRMEIPSNFKRKVELDGTGTSDNPAQYKKAAKPRPVFKPQAAPQEQVNSADIPF